MAAAIHETTYRTSERLSRTRGMTSTSLDYNPMVDGSESDEEKLDNRINQYMGVVILLNVLEVGAEHQWKPSDNPALFRIYLAMDCVFAVLYSAEVVYGLTTKRCDYWKNAWNVTNLVLTVLAIVSIVSDITGSADLSGTEILRMVRFVRLARLLRLFNAIPDLVMVVEGLLSSLKSLSWVLFLLVIMMWVFAIFFTMTIGHDYEEEFQGVDYFGDMGHSMMTLMDIAILSEWGQVVRPVFNNQPYLLPFFIIFALTSAFGMLNVMIGVIVDKTHQARKQLEDQTKTAQIREASQIWISKINTQGLSRNQIRASVNEQEIADKEAERHRVIKEILQEILDNPNSINFPHGLTPEDVISLLDFDASGNLSRPEFVEGLKRLLLGDEFQLTCLILTVMGKMRKEHADSSIKTSEQLTAVMQRLDRIENALHIGNSPELQRG